jgi:hypothetical protein
MSLQLQLPIGDLLHKATERDLASIAVALGARLVSGWSAGEEALASKAPPHVFLLNRIRDQIVAGEDPLGEAFCSIRSVEHRRHLGATYTPNTIIGPMLQWARSNGKPARVIDPGAGSGRFLFRAARDFPTAQLVGFEIDPLAAMIARANLATAGLADRSALYLCDYRAVEIPPIGGQTLYIGNPPYVRHHQIEAKWKAWLTAEGNKLGARVSQLAGLHAYFFLATVTSASNGDYGAFITAAEWLDVNYGQLIRDLFLGRLGGHRIVVMEPTARPFPDAATTAAVTYFKIGTRPRVIRLQRINAVSGLKDLNGNRVVRRERLASERRWSHLTRSVRPGPAGFIELGELCRVHRGQVTGANRIWIAGIHSKELPESVLYPTVTRAQELFRAGKILLDSSVLRRVIDLPIDLSVFSVIERRKIDQFLTYARHEGVDKGYIASNRRAWWSVGLREPAPILSTYMARRPPAFVHNKALARHINIAHGIYPREPMDELEITNLTTYLATATRLTDGRIYAGGLTKFEPREMERLLVPGIEFLRQGINEFTSSMVV